MSMEKISVSKAKSIAEEKDLEPGLVKGTDGIQFTKGNNDRIKTVSWDEFEEKLENLVDDSITSDKSNGLFSKLGPEKVYVSQEEHDNVLYHIKKDIMENGKLEPLLRDTYIEDIHAISLKDIAVLHKIFDLLETNLAFESEKELETYIRRMSNRMGESVSKSDPITDGSLPDGSRVNIIYSKDISKGGSSFTIRRFSDEPLTVTQLIKFGTLSPKMAAYLWLCLEFSMSVIVSGVTASGKTTTMNSLLPFIGFNRKIYSAEDTPEVRAPQPVWQRLVTRETGPKDSRVELFDLVKTALRSRPDYIVIGEVRGREGSAAFQAIQTGHPVISTFHSSGIEKLIQRFTGEPINVPIRFMDNLNVALFQQIVYHDGQILRRCDAVEEILRYSKEKEGVLTRQVFNWDPVNDDHNFTGMHNSYILEEKVAPKLRLDDPKMIYDELERRADVLENMVEANITRNEDVARIFKNYSEQGFKGIPEGLRATSEEE